MSLIKIISEQNINNYLDENFSTEKGLITVYVGWGLAKENGASILNHHIKENIYWTFLPTEKRKMFEQSLIDFKKIAFDKIKSKVKYFNIDPLGYKNEAELTNFIREKFQQFTVYLYKKRIYFYKGNQKQPFAQVYHLDLDLLDFMSWDVIDDIKDIKKVEEEIKYLDVKYLPYLIDAEKNNFSSDICTTRKT